MGFISLPLRVGTRPDPGPALVLQATLLSVVIRSLLRV